MPPTTSSNTKSEMGPSLLARRPTAHISASPTFDINVNVNMLTRSKGAWSYLGVLSTAHTGRATNQTTLQLYWLLVPTCCPSSGQPGHQCFLCLAYLRLKQPFLPQGLLCPLDWTYSSLWCWLPLLSQQLLTTSSPRITFSLTHTILAPLDALFHTSLPAPPSIHLPNPREPAPHI